MLIATIESFSILPWLADKTLSVAVELTLSTISVGCSAVPKVVLSELVIIWPEPALETSSNSVTDVGSWKVKKA